MPHKLYALLRTLERHHLWFMMDRLGSDSVTLTVTVEENRLEIDIFEDERVEYACYKSNQKIAAGGKNLDALISGLAAIGRQWPPAPR
ncbi:hypothetical protein J8I29_15275 [Labrys sp. LIt4]|uniref:hypothetical protein n=1 Tax=Labrys sp. LIt4 TaxID=2821355 RepID=UPI001ADFDD55|nr:hypothetical protein [Labrys sp. LIt4]MBP0580686.1 hypothetical protein [Labrys sp. LIt4]